MPHTITFEAAELHGETVLATIAPDPTGAAVITDAALTEAASPRSGLFTLEIASPPSDGTYVISLTVGGLFAGIYWTYIAGTESRARPQYQQNDMPSISEIAMEVNSNLSTNHGSGAWGGGPTASQIADAVWDEAQSEHVAVGSFGLIASEIADILTDTAVIGVAGAGLSGVPWNAAWDTEVQSEVQDAIEVNHLDHLLAVDYNPASKPGIATALFNELIGSDAGVSQFTANALELSPSGSGGGGGGGGGPTTAEIRAALLDLFRAISRVNATVPGDLGGTFNPATDSLEALQQQFATAYAASAPVRAVTRGSLVYYLDETIPRTITLPDASLSGQTLRLLIDEGEDDSHGELHAADVTVSGSTVVFTNSAAVTDKTRTARWALRGLTVDGKQVHFQGAVLVKVAARET